MLKRNKDEQNRETRRVSIRETHFDEQNLEQTHHPQNKDYGLMSINESKTPFPRRAEPVDATQLRERLLAMNRELEEQQEDDQASFSMSSADVNMPNQPLSTPVRSFNNGSGHGSGASADSFLEKRKKFYASEYLIAKQRSLNNEVHEPGSGVEMLNTVRSSLGQTRLMSESRIMSTDSQRRSSTQ